MPFSCHDGRVAPGRRDVRTLATARYWRFHADVTNNPPSEIGRRKLGRPRPLVTVRRDQAIAQMLTEHGPMATRDVADRLRLPPELIRLAMRRLREQGKVRRSLDDGGRSVWHLVD